MFEFKHSDKCFLTKISWRTRFAQRKLLIFTFLVCAGYGKFEFPTHKKNDNFLESKYAPQQLWQASEWSNVPSPPCVVQSVNNKQQLSQSTEIEIAIFSYRINCHLHDLTLVDVCFFISRRFEFELWKV